MSERAKTYLGYLASALCVVLVAGVFYLLWRDIRDDRTGIDNAREQLDSVGAEQQRATESVERIESGLADSEGKLDKISGTVSDAKSTVSVIGESVSDTKSAISDAQERINNGEGILDDSEQRIKECRGILERIRQRAGANAE